MNRQLWQIFVLHMLAHCRHGSARVRLFKVCDVQSWCSGGQRATSTKKWNRWNFEENICLTQVMMANTRHSHLAACLPYLTACCVAKARDLSPALNHTIVRVVTSGAHRHDVFGASHLWSLGQGHPSRNHPGHTVYCITHVSLSSHLAGCLLAEFLLNRNSAGWLPTSSKWCGCLSPSVHSHCTLRTLLTWTSHKVRQKQLCKMHFQFHVALGCSRVAVGPVALWRRSLGRSHPLACCTTTKNRETQDDQHTLRGSIVVSLHCASPATFDERINPNISSCCRKS